MGRAFCPQRRAFGPLLKQFERILMRRHRIENRHPTAAGGALAVALAAVGWRRRSTEVGSAYPVKGKVTLPDGKPPRGECRLLGTVTVTAPTESDGTFAFKGDTPGCRPGNTRSD